MADSTDDTVTFHDLWNVRFRWKTPYPVTELPVQFNLLLRLIMYNFTQSSVVPSWKQQRVFSSSLTHHFRRRVLVDLMPSSHNEDINTATTKKRKRTCDPDMGSPRVLGSRLIYDYIVIQQLPIFSKLALPLHRWYHNQSSIWAYFGQDSLSDPD